MYVREGEFVIYLCVRVCNMCVHEGEIICVRESVREGGTICVRESVCESVTHVTVHTSNILVIE